MRQRRTTSRVPRMPQGEEVEPLRTLWAESRSRVGSVVEWGIQTYNTLLYLNNQVKS